MNTAKSAVTSGIRGVVQKAPTRTRYSMNRDILEDPKISPWNVKSDYPYYHRHVVTPPRNYINKWEKMFWGFFIAGFTYSVPAYIVYHWRDYGKSNDDGDEE